MKKRTYQRQKNQLYRTIKRNILLERRIKVAESEAEEARTEANKYKKRFHDFGSNVDTIDLESGKNVCMVKWELTPIAYGNYARLDPEFAASADIDKQIKRMLTENIVKGLIENELVQFICKDYSNTPFGDSSVAAKLYVVAWEQMPHKKILELNQYVDGWTEGV